MLCVHMLVCTINLVYFSTRFIRSKSPILSLTPLTPSHISSLPLQYRPFNLLSCNFTISAIFDIFFVFMRSGFCFSIKWFYLIVVAVVAVVPFTSFSGRSRLSQRQIRLANCMLFICKCIFFWWDLKWPM